MKIRIKINSETIIAIKNAIDLKTQSKSDQKIIEDLLTKILNKTELKAQKLSDELSEY